MRSALTLLIGYTALFGVAKAQDIAIANAIVYTSPGTAAQPHTTVLIRGGKIVAVGKGVTVPSGVAILPCRDCVVFAGFDFVRRMRLELPGRPLDTLQSSVIITTSRTRESIEVPIRQAASGER